MRVHKILSDYLPEHYYSYGDLRAAMADWLRTYEFRGQAGSRGFLERSNGLFVRQFLLQAYPRDHIVSDGTLGDRRVIGADGKPTSKLISYRMDPTWYNNYGKGAPPGSVLSKFGQIMLGDMRVADYCSPTDAYYMMHSLSRGRDPAVRKPMARPECVGRCMKWSGCPCLSNANTNHGCGGLEGMPDPYDDELAVNNGSQRLKYGDSRRYEFPRPPKTYYLAKYKVDFDSSDTRASNYYPEVHKSTMAGYRKQLLNML